MTVGNSNFAPGPRASSSQPVQNMPNPHFTGGTHSAIPTNYTVLAESTQANNNNTTITTAPYTTTSMSANSYDAINGVEGFNWDFFHERVNDDLLFGILEEGDI